MRWLSSCFALGLLTGLCLGQAEKLTIGNKTFSLEPTRLVAEGVQKFAWSPDGEDLAYATASSVGAFSLETRDNQPLVKLDEKETVSQIVWLNTGHEALVLSRKPLAEGDAPTDIVTVRSIDSRKETARELLTLSVPRGDGDVAQIDVSPLISFALLEFNQDDKRTYYVLTNGGRLTRSSDIDEAVKEGKEFDAWSSSGTALFGPIQALQFKIALDGREADVQDLGVLRLNFVLAKAVSDNEDAVALLTNSIRGRSNLQQGEVVLECVPGNGALRQVRFSGQYQASGEPLGKLALHLQTVPFQLGNVKASTKALWLIDQASKKDPQAALLVTPQADQWWLGPMEKAVAFSANGSIFVRPIVMKN